MERLSAVLGQAVQFVYTCWDRIVLSGYLERLQRPENLIYFFHDVVGVDEIEPAVLERSTTSSQPVSSTASELGQSWRSPSQTPRVQSSGGAAEPGRAGAGGPIWPLWFAMRWTSRQLFWLAGGAFSNAVYVRTGDRLARDRTVGTRLGEDFSRRLR